ncbi:hypothetical protein ABPG72_011901 [Tetrahymena utriculariae]
MEGQDMFVTQTLQNLQEYDSLGATMNQQSSQSFHGNFQTNPQYFIRLYENKVKECQLKINLDSPRTKSAIIILKMPADKYTLRSYAYFEKMHNYEEKQAKLKQSIQSSSSFKTTPQNDYMQHLVSVHANLEQIIHERHRLIKQENARLRKTAEGCSRKSLQRQAFSGDLDQKNSKFQLDKLNIEHKFDKVNLRNDKEHNIQEFEMNNELKKELLMRKTMIDSQMSLERANSKKQKFLNEKLMNVKRQNQKVAFKQRKIKIENSKKIKDQMGKIVKMYKEQDEIQKKVEEIKFKKFQELENASFHEKGIQAKQKNLIVQEKLHQRSQELQNYFQLRDQHVLNLMSDYWSRKTTQIQDQNQQKQEKSEIAQKIQKERESLILQKVIQNYESHSLKKETKVKKQVIDSKFHLKKILVQTSTILNTLTKQMQPKKSSSQNQEEEKPVTFQEKVKKNLEKQKQNKSLLMKSEIQQIEQLNNQWTKKIDQAAKRQPQSITHLNKQEELQEYIKERQTIKSQSMQRNNFNFQSLFQSTQEKCDKLLDKQKKVQEKIQKEKQDKELLRTFSMQSTLQIQYEKEKRLKQLEKLQKLTPKQFVQQLKMKKVDVSQEEMVKYFPEAVVKENQNNEDTE